VAGDCSFIAISEASGYRIVRHVNLERKMRLQVCPDSLSGCLERRHFGLRPRVDCVSFLDSHYLLWEIFLTSVDIFVATLGRCEVVLVFSINEVRDRLAAGWLGSIEIFLRLGKVFEYVYMRVLSELEHCGTSADAEALQSHVSRVNTIQTFPERNRHRRSSLQRIYLLADNHSPLCD
jgi:hypothetical protein